MAENPFDGMSRRSLQEALLNRHSRIANLRSDSKHLRSRLGDVRSELHELEHDLKLIEEQLYVAKFPAPFIDVEVVQPVVEITQKKRSA